MDKFTEWKQNPLWPALKLLRRRANHVLCLFFQRGSDQREYWDPTQYHCTLNETERKAESGALTSPVMNLQLRAVVRSLMGREKWWITSSSPGKGWPKRQTMKTTPCEGSLSEPEWAGAGTAARGVSWGVQQKGVWTLRLTVNGTN